MPVREGARRERCERQWPAATLVLDWWPVRQSGNVGDNALLLGIVESLGRTTLSTTVLTPILLGSSGSMIVWAPRKHPLKLVRLLWSVDTLVFTGGSPFFDHVARSIALR
ncbi:MAG: hypothetical protein U0361_13845 [Nitrospiraceae bacterium]